MCKVAPYGEKCIWEMDDPKDMSMSCSVCHLSYEFRNLMKTIPFFGRLVIDYQCPNFREGWWY